MRQSRAARFVKAAKPYVVKGVAAVALSQAICARVPQIFQTVEARSQSSSIPDVRNPAQLEAWKRLDVLEPWTQVEQLHNKQVAIVYYGGNGGDTAGKDT